MDVKSGASYFELLGLPASFDLALPEIERAYFALQRRYHPDRFAAKPPAERQQALNISLRLNEAYEALKSPLKRAQHLLALQAIRVNGEGDTVKPSQALLMEIMEWRERLAEGEKGAIMQEVAAAGRETLSALSALFASQDWQGAAHAAIRLNYITKLREELR